MGKFTAIFCVTVLFTPNLSASLINENIVTKSVELSDRTNGTTTTITVDATQKVILGCLRRGYKHSKLGWFSDTRRLETEDKERSYVSTSLLHLQGLKSENSTLVYFCRTENLPDNLWSRVEVIVKDEIDILQYSIELTEISSSQPSKLVVPAPKTAEVTCFFQDMNPPETEWYLDGVRLETQDSKTDFASSSKITISYEQLNSSGKKYACRSGDPQSDIFAVVEMSSEGKLDSKMDTPFLKRDFLLTVIILSLIVALCTLLCVVGVYCIRHRQHKKENVHNLERGNSILKDESYFVLKGDQRPFLAPPSPEIPFVHTGISAQGQSYYDRNIVHGHF